MRIFNAYASTDMIKWRKVSAGSDVLNNGHRAFAQYSASFSPRVKLRKRTATAFFRENLLSTKPNYDYCVEQITYEYTCRFDFEMAGQKPGATVVSFETKEEIDPQFKCKRDILKHFEAPWLPAGFGDVGARFLHSLRIH